MSSKILELIRRLGRFGPIVAVAGACAACNPAASPPVVSATPPPTKTVSDPVAGIASMLTADVQAGINDLIAAGANGASAPLPLQDSLTCGNWILQAIPQAQSIVNGIVPSNTQVKGPYSLFISGKIAAYNIKGTVSSAQTTFVDTFNHYCGAAVAGDVNAITVLLAKAGIAVAVPGGGVLGILPNLFSESLIRTRYV